MAEGNHMTDVLTADLVRRLRFEVLDRTNGSESGMMRTMREAADEIEQLRKDRDVHAANLALVLKLEADIERLRRGEFICSKCGLRKNAEAPDADF